MPEQISIDTQGPDGGRPYLRDLADGDSVSAVFAVRGHERRQKRNGEDFARLVLADRTGSVPAMVWDEADAVLEVAASGAAVHVTGQYSLHERYGPQITVRSIRHASSDEFDQEEITEAPATPVERLEADVRELLETIQNPHLRRLLDAFFAPGSPTWERFREAPAAKTYHQAYHHGLLEHTLSVAQGVSAAASYFPGIDRDVAVTGALLHDIGKTEAYNDDPLAIDFTDAGRLEGEIPLGYYLVRREIERLGDFEEKLARSILHIILSHHGTLEHGSPVVPATREATLVHAIDNLGGKLGSFDRIERGLRDGEAWSGFDRAIAGSAYFGSRAA